ncbi:fibroblast growth factor receptor-like 1 [Pollicipes pollicipes]|uniref:fibroblast growth factor receptor-like 1 n=1 Tax=Pollicipes pollicipes TaxID=41117 RepID=UPI001884F6D6|nr:fibroblast growth factor receptor-like 1 [Pollicipes pollicipes]
MGSGVNDFRQGRWPDSTASGRAGPGPELRQVSEFGRAKLSCPRLKRDGAQLRRTAQLRWFRNGRPLLQAAAAEPGPVFVPSDRRIRLRSNKLRILDVQLGDAGSYSCLLSVAGGPPRWSNYTLIVSENLYSSDLPEVDSQYGEYVDYDEKPPPPRLGKLKVVPLGDALTLHCGIRGNPLPVVRWLYNGKPVSESVHTANMVEVRQFSLRLPQVRQYDNGEYTCVGENPLGQVNHTFHVEANMVPPADRRTSTEHQPHRRRPRRR